VRFEAFISMRKHCSSSYYSQTIAIPENSRGKEKLTDRS